MDSLFHDDLDRVAVTRHARALRACNGIAIMFGLISLNLVHVWEFPSVNVSDPRNFPRPRILTTATAAAAAAAAAAGDGGGGAPAAGAVDHVAGRALQVAQS